MYVRCVFNLVLYNRVIVFVSMFWLNAKKRGAWKLHRDSCRFCAPMESRWQGLNQMKKYGGWFSFETYQRALEYFESKKQHGDYWQPCKECKPE